MKKSTFNQKGIFKHWDRIELFHVINMGKSKPSKFRKHSRILQDTFPKKNKDIFIQAKIDEHRENIVHNPNPKTHTNASIEMVLGRGKNEKAYIHSQVWC